MTPWTVARQAPRSVGFPRQEYWSGLPFPSPGGLPDPGIKPRSPALQADSLPSEPPGKPHSNVHTKNMYKDKMSVAYSLTLCQAQCDFGYAVILRIVANFVRADG